MSQEQIAGTIEVRYFDHANSFEQSVHNGLHKELSARGVPLGEPKTMTRGCDHEEIVPVPVKGKLDWGVTDYGKVFRFRWIP